MTERLMPERVRLGTNLNTTMMFPMGQWKTTLENPEEENPMDKPTVMGFVLPDWQRPLVWTPEQMVSFIESAWKGIPLGTFTFNRATFGSPYDNLLIDGQQRLHAIQCYLEDKFPVFGYYWSELTELDHRLWKTEVTFPCYETGTEDEAYLRNYYNLMNFGGTAHTEDQRA